MEAPMKKRLPEMRPARLPSRLAPQERRYGPSTTTGPVGAAAIHPTRTQPTMTTVPPPRAQQQQQLGPQPSTVMSPPPSRPGSHVVRRTIERGHSARPRLAPTMPPPPPPPSMRPIYDEHGIADDDYLDVEEAHVGGGPGGFAESRPPPPPPTRRAQRVRCLKLRTTVAPDLLMPYLYGEGRGHINNIMDRTGCTIDFCPLSPEEQTHSPQSMTHLMNFLVSAGTIVQLDAACRMLRGLVERVQHHVQQKCHDHCHSLDKPENEIEGAEQTSKDEYGVDADAIGGFENDENLDAPFVKNEPADFDYHGEYAAEDRRRRHSHADMWVEEEEYHEPMWLPGRRYVQAEYVRHRRRPRHVYRRILIDDEGYPIYPSHASLRRSPRNQRQSYSTQRGRERSISRGNLDSTTEVPDMAQDLEQINTDYEEHFSRIQQRDAAMHFSGPRPKRGMKRRLDRRMDGSHHHRRPFRYAPRLVYDYDSYDDEWSDFEVEESSDGPGVFNEGYQAPGSHDIAFTIDVADSGTQIKEADEQHTKVLDIPGSDQTNSTEIPNMLSAEPECVQASNMTVATAVDCNDTNNVLKASCYDALESEGIVSSTTTAPSAAKSGSHTLLQGDCTVPSSTSRRDQCKSCSCSKVKVPTKGPPNDQDTMNPTHLRSNNTLIRSLIQHSDHSEKGKQFWKKYSWWRSRYHQQRAKYEEIEHWRLLFGDHCFLKSILYASSADAISAVADAFRMPLNDIATKGQIRQYVKALEHAIDAVVETKKAREETGTTFMLSEEAHDRDTSETLAMDVECGFADQSDMDDGIPTDGTWVPSLSPAASLEIKEEYQLDVPGEAPSFVASFVNDLVTSTSLTPVMASAQRRLLREIKRSDPYYYLHPLLVQDSVKAPCSFGCVGGSSIKWERKVVSQISSRMKWFDSVAYSLAKVSGGKELLSRKKMNSTVRKLHLVALQLHCLIAHLYCLRKRAICREIDSLPTALNNSYYEKRMNGYKSRLKLTVNQQHSHGDTPEELMRDTFEFFPELLLCIDVWGFDSRARGNTSDLPVQFLERVRQYMLDFEGDKNGLLQGICEELLGILCLWNDFKWGEGLEQLTLDSIKTFENKVKSSIRNILQTHARHLLALWSAQLVDHPSPLNRVRLTQQNIYYSELFVPQQEVKAVDIPDEQYEQAVDSPTTLDTWVHGNEIGLADVKCLGEQDLELFKPDEIASWSDATKESHMMKWNEVHETRQQCQIMSDAASRLISEAQFSASDDADDLLTKVFRARIIADDAVHASTRVALHSAAHQLRNVAESAKTPDCSGSSADDEKMNIYTDDGPDTKDLLQIITSTNHELTEICGQRARSARVRDKLQTQSVDLARQSMQLFNTILCMTDPQIGGTKKMK